jgi:hypothetical protein
MMWRVLRRVKVLWTWWRKICGFGGAWDLGWRTLGLQIDLGVTAMRRPRP